jgi:hypothetical protein
MSNLSGPKGHNTAIRSKKCNMQHGYVNVEVLVFGRRFSFVSEQHIEEDLNTQSNKHSPQIAKSAKRIQEVSAGKLVKEKA